MTWLFIAFTLLGVGLVAGSFFTKNENVSEVLWCVGAAAWFVGLLTADIAGLIGF